MTPAERAVLARYPDAECWRRYDAGANVQYYVTQATLENERAVVQTLGTGPTPSEAWANAAAWLTQGEG